MADPQTAVNNAAAKFAAAETALQKAFDSLVKMPKDFRDVHDGSPLEIPEGGGPQFGFLEMSEFSSRARSLAGMVADAQTALYAFHRECTDRAESLRLDTPGILSGGGR